MQVNSSPEPLDPFFALLNTEIAKAISKPKIEAALSTAKRAAANKTKPDADRLAAMAEAARLSAELTTISWTGQANVAVFRRKPCACGSCSVSFIRMMQRVHSNAKPVVERWAAGLDFNPSLPNEVVYQDDTTTPICEYCADLSGFDLSLGVVIHKEKLYAPAA